MSSNPPEGTTPPAPPPAPMPLKAMLDRDKRRVVDELMAAGRTLNVHLDPRHPGVVVPPEFRAQPHLVLCVGLALANPIRDLALGRHGLSGTLSFRGRPFYCTVPWAAVFAAWVVDTEQLLLMGPIPSAPPAVPPASKGAKVIDFKAAAARIRARRAAPPKGGAL